MLHHISAPAGDLQKLLKNTFCAASARCLAGGLCWNHLNLHVYKHRDIARHAMGLCRLLVDVNFGGDARVAAVYKAAQTAMK